MRTPIILLVDDDAQVGAALERDVERRYGDGYRVMQVTRGEEALKLCRSLDAQETPVALLLADQGLPDGPGATFLAEARAVCPQAGRALLTSHADTEAAIVDVNEVGLDRYMVKPWGSPDEELYPALDELLADWRARASLPYTRVADVMETDIARLHAGASLAEAAETAARTRVGDLMVVDDGGFVGVLSEGDILRSSLPDLDEILAAGGTLYDGYQLFMSKSRELSGKPIKPLVIEQPLVMHPDDHVARAATVLIDRQIRLLPVVADGRLVGTVSRANICRAVVDSA